MKTGYKDADVCPYCGCEKLNAKRKYCIMYGREIVRCRTCNKPLKPGHDKCTCCGDVIEEKTKTFIRTEVLVWF